jgi:hypothetical protein
VADCIDPSVNADQVAARDPILNQVAREPSGEKLPAGDHAVLPPSDRSKRSVNKGALCRYTRY